jgi:hypothetical protein
VVAVKPKLGALMITTWLWSIIVNLLLVPGYLMSRCAIWASLWARALARLAEREE